MRARVLALLGLASLAGANALGAQGVATRVTVRVVAHDATVIGSGVGGARVMVRNPATGAVLFEGLQEGNTGDTRLIVEEPLVRGAAIYDTPGTAGLTVELRLAEPTVLEFVGQGPLGYAHAVQEATTTMLIAPGQDVLGDGVVLTLHGFIVELLEPTELVAGGETAVVTARVRMLCGSELEPGGLWDADRVAVIAELWHDGALVREVPLAHAGEPSLFSGEIVLEGVSAGASLTIVATDPMRANFGRSETLHLH